MLNSNSTSASSSSLLSSLNFVGAGYHNHHPNHHGAYPSSASLKGYGVGGLEDSLLGSSIGGHHHHHHQQQQQQSQQHRHLQHPRTISLGDHDSSGQTSPGSTTLMTPAQSLQWTLQSQGRDASSRYSASAFEDDGSMSALNGLSSLSRRNSECRLFCPFLVFDFCGYG